MTLAKVLPIRTVDHYDLDDGDATHPIYVRYVMPADSSGFYKATLSFHPEAFRSTVSLNPSAVGAETGHSHSHGHTLAIQAAIFANAVGNATGGTPGQLATAGGMTDTTTVQANAAGSSGHSHSLTGSSSQAVTDGPIATVTAISVDGVDVTGTLGGPWNGDVVEMDITAVFQTDTGRWHTIALTLSGLGRICSLLRLYHST
jgi:hypothetical protein